jgi:hypothetical protein
MDGPMPEDDPHFINFLLEQVNVVNGLFIPRDDSVVQLLALSGDTRVFRSPGA